MRVLVVEPLLTLGGQERFSVALASQLERQGLQVLIGCSKTGAGVSIARAEGLNLVPVGLGGKRDVGTIGRLLLHVKKWRPDVVHAHGSYGGAYGRAVAWLAGIPAIWTVQLDPRWNNPRMLAARMTRCAYTTTLTLLDRVTAATVFVSEGLRNSFAELVNPLRSATYTIPNAITRSLPEVEKIPGRRALARAQWNIPGNATVIGTLAALVQRKRIDLLIRSVAALKDENVYVLVAGEGTERASLQILAETLGVAKRVIFVGQLDRLDDYFAAIDFGALVSDAEGLPLAALETLACGIPMIISDIPSHQELRRYATAVRFVSAGSAKELAEQICQLSIKRSAANASLAQSVRSTFSIESIARRYVDVYEATLKRTATSRAGAARVS